MKKYQVYGIGNALLDMEFDVTPEFLQSNNIEKGVMTLVDESRQLELMEALGASNIRKIASGGSAINALIALQHFGSRAFCSCLIANDETGDHYFNDITEAGLDTNFLHHKRNSGHTGKCLALVTEDADRTMNTFLGVSSKLSSSELHFEALEQSEYLYLEGYLVTEPNALQACKLAKTFAEENGIKTSITLSDPAIVTYFHQQFVDLIGDGVDLLFCNEDEALVFTGTDNIDAAKVELQKVAKNFVITLGSKGSVAFDSKEFIEIAPNMVDAVDSTGAGDMYAGAFLHGIMAGMSFAKAGRLASLTAAQIVSQYGARITKTDAAELLERLVTATA